MAKFDLAAVLGDVSKLDTGITPDGREQIEYIDISLIDPDPNNFYELTSIDELAASIELLGIQQPLRVRDEADKPGRVMIVSGHRRRAALELLVKEGKDRFASVPCIREANAGSAALQELRLIYANSDTRRLSSAEISKQAERVESLLYQLKEEGMEFPGRMRDHVAEACKVSKSKIARLKVIRDGLDSGIAKKYESGEMNEAVAYAFARQPVKVQIELYDRLCIGPNGCKYVTENQVESYLFKKSCLDHDCKIHDGKCTNAARMLDKICESTSYLACSGRKNACCLDCYDLKNCGASCVFAAKKKTELRVARKAEINEEKEKARRSADAAMEDLRLLWSRFKQARTEAGKTFDDIRDIFHWRWTLTASERDKCEAGVVTERSNTPFGVSADLAAVRIIRDMADCLGCSVDYLLGRTDDPSLGGGSPGPVAWTEGSPTESGLYVMITEIDGFKYSAHIYHYDAENNAIHLPGGANMDMVCLRYIRLPED